MTHNPSYDATSDQVSIAWISPGQVESRFMTSMLGLVTYEQNRGGATLAHRATFIEMISSPRIAEARSQVVKEFLRSTADWLLMVDADMTFRPDTLERMLMCAHPVDRPVIGGLAFAGGRQGSSIYPTIYRRGMHKNRPVPERVEDFPSAQIPRDTLIKVFATGAACLLVHRSVFTKMAKAYAKLADGRTNPYPWFVEGSIDGEGAPLGEDISFCMRLDPLDIPIHVHTGIEFGHVKTHELNLALYMKERRAT